MKQRPKLDVDKFIKKYTEALAAMKDDLTDQNIATSNIFNELVTPVTPPFFNNTTKCNSLHPFNNKGYKACVTPVTPVTPKNDNVQSINLSLEDFEERAAIIEHDGCIPRNCAEAIAKMQLRAKPNSITLEKWQEIQNSLEMLTPYLKDVIAHGWKISDIFGCHPTAPQKRFDVMGLLMLLNEGERIIEITKDAIRMQNKRGTVQSYYRRFYSSQTEQSCLHEIV